MHQLFFFSSNKMKIKYKLNGGMNVEKDNISVELSKDKKFDIEDFLKQSDLPVKIIQKRWATGKIGPDSGCIDTKRKSALVTCFNSSQFGAP